jgi:hypothetical protein
MSIPRIVAILTLTAAIGLLGVSTTEAKGPKPPPYDAVPFVMPFPPGLAICIDFTASDECDSDGWSGAIERQLGSDPNNGASTPEYGLVDEQLGLSTCSDGLDNDLDGKTDKKDRACKVTCRDYAGGRVCHDRDRDGWRAYVEVRYGSDPFDGSSTPETAFVPATCSDGADNDGDGGTDVDDPEECGGPICIDFDAGVVCAPF